MEETAMIRVAITAQRFESTLRSGFKLGTLIEVINGLPYNAQLANAEFDKGKGYVYLYFTQPNVPDTDITDLAITLKSVQARPVDLDKVPVPAPAAGPVTVERNIG